MSQPIGCKVLLDRKVRKLHHSRVLIPDDRNQTRARGKQCLVLTRPSPVRVQFRNPSLTRGIEINGKHLRKFFDAKWTHGDGQAMQETMGMFTICLVDVSQHSLVSLVEGFGQFVKDASDTWRKTVSQ